MQKETDPESLRAIGTGRILGIDYGRKRIGLALSDPSQILASTLETLKNLNRDAQIENIIGIAKEKNVSAIVVGKPLHMNGAIGEMATEVTGFVHALAEKIDTPIFMWDERWTTTRAERLLLETGRSPSKSRNKIDQLAAAYLLQSFLDRIVYLRTTDKSHDKK